MGDEMTREQALNYMRSSGWSEEQINTVTEAFTCEDAISRQAAIDALCDASIPIVYKGKPSFVVDYVGVIADLPSVSTKKAGRWVSTDEEPHEVWECDHCGFVIDGSGCVDPYDYRDTYKYCPNCGAKMGVEE